MSETNPFGNQQAAASGAAPGWYPTGDGWQRYWDGAQWTEHQAPVDTAAAGGQYLAPIDSNDTGMALLAHLGGAVFGFIVPLIVYLIKKDESPFLRHHSAEALNFHFTAFIASMVSAVLMLVLIGFFMLIAVVIVFWIFTIMASIAANRGEYYRYPMTIRVFN